MNPVPVDWSINPQWVRARRQLAKRWPVDMWGTPYCPWAHPAAQKCAKGDAEIARWQADLLEIGRPPKFNWMVDHPDWTVEDAEAASASFAEAHPVKVWWDGNTFWSHYDDGSWRGGKTSISVDRVIETIRERPLPCVWYRCGDQQEEVFDLRGLSRAPAKICTNPSTIDDLRRCPIIDVEQTHVTRPSRDLAPYGIVTTRYWCLVRLRAGVIMEHAPN